MIPTKDQTRSVASMAAEDSFADSQNLAASSTGVLHPEETEDEEAEVHSSSSEW